jgi:class 3 adenylate cyclase
LIRKIKIYTILVLGFFLFFAFQNVFGKAFVQKNGHFILNLKAFETIPSKYLEFVEGFDENTSFKTLSQLDWQKKINSDEAFVNGYWVRFSVLNYTGNSKIGISYNYNNEKKVYTLSNNKIREYSYWSEKKHSWIDEGRIRASYKVLMKPNEVTEVYSFFRKKPFDRYMGRDSLHRMTISSWENIQIYQFVKIASNIATFAIAFTFAIYYLFIFIVSKGNYLWLSLSLFQISFLSITNLILGRILGVPEWSYASEFSLASISLLFLLMLQFFRKSLNLKINFPRVNKVFLLAILFYIFMVALNLYSSLSWPSVSYLELNLYPPDMNGPGIVKVKYLFIPFLILLLSSAVMSFLLWKKGSSYAKYLCISFALPFLSVPISGITYLFYDFSWITWLIINSAVGVLLLSMFITFGFAVAQQLNDIKLLALQQQVKLTKAYQRFVPLQLLKNLGKKSIVDVSLGDQVNVKMTILFSDIRSFTSISESMTPKENFEFLNNYLSEMSPIIRDNNGYIDKFMGDGIMALFKNSANDAVNAAIKMQRYLCQYNIKAETNGQHIIKIGIGINTGQMMLGTLGETNRMEGSVISDSVNLASRLESVNKIYKTDIIISEETIKNLDKNLFNSRLIDIVTVKGKNKPIKIYEIFDAEIDVIKSLKKQTLNDFKKAILAYQDQSFETSLSLLNKILKVNPNDQIVSLYIERCTKILKEGWNPNRWDGVQHLNEK